MTETLRILDHPVLGPLPQRETYTFTYAGRPVTALAGETIGAALLAAGIRTLRHHEVSGRPRGMYCAIGHCYECRVTVNGVPGVRACLTPVAPGMVVEPGTGGEDTHGR